MRLHNVFLMLVSCLNLMGWARVAAAKSETRASFEWAISDGGSVGGYASGEAKFGGAALTTLTGHDILVAKFDAKGNLGWLHQGHGSSNAMIHELTADNAGNVWASGMFQGELKLADRTIANQGKHDILLTSFDSAGMRLWTKTAGGPGIDYGLGVATDGRGNGYFTGSFTGSVEFDGTLHSSSTAASDIQVLSVV